MLGDAVVIRFPTEFLQIGLILAIGCAVLLTLFLRRGALRRHLRSRRGLCPQCTYPIGTSPVCTECGAALKKGKET